MLGVLARESTRARPTTQRVLLPFTLEVPFCAGMLLSRQQQFPLLEGFFRGRGPFSSNGGVKSLGYRSSTDSSTPAASRSRSGRAWAYRSSVIVARA